MCYSDDMMTLVFIYSLSTTALEALEEEQTIRQKAGWFKSAWFSMPWEQAGLAVNLAVNL